MTIFTIIVAMDGEHRAIGVDGGLPWQRIPSDMRRFQQLTTGHPVIMGRKTWESLPENRRPLAGRANIVLTRDGERAQDIRAAGAAVAADMDEAKRLVAGDPDAFIIGGAEIYREALAFADRMEITYVSIVLVPSEATVCFPEWKKGEWSAQGADRWNTYALQDPRDPWHTRYQTLVRIRA